MGVLDSIRWAVRMALTIIVAVVIVIILSYTIPNVDAPELHADILAGRVVYAGGFTSGTGMVLEERFTQDVANQHLVIPSTIDREKVYRFAAQASLVADGEDLGSITYNPRGQDTLEPLRGLDNIRSDVRVLPVSVRRADGRLQDGLLTVEVLYGS